MQRQQDQQHPSRQHSSAQAQDLPGRAQSQVVDRHGTGHRQRRHQPAAHQVGGRPGRLARQ
ncbi:hypothetical protein D3C79_659390 [compost metagenome]